MTDGAGILAGNTYKYETDFLRRHGYFPSAMRVQHWARMNTWTAVGVIKPWSEKKPYTGGHRLKRKNMWAYVREAASKIPDRFLEVAGLAWIATGTLILCAVTLKVLFWQ